MIYYYDMMHVSADFQPHLYTLHVLATAPESKKPRSLVPS